MSRHLPPRQREKRWVGEGLLPVPGAVVSRALSRVHPGPSLLPFPGSLPAHLPVWLPKTCSLLPTLPCTTSSINFFLRFSLCGSLSLFLKCFPVFLVPHCILIYLSTFPSLYFLIHPSVLYPITFYIFFLRFLLSISLSLFFKYFLCFLYPITV